MSPVSVLFKIKKNERELRREPIASARLNIKMTVKIVNNFVGGEFVALGDSKAKVPVTNPATGATIAEVRVSDAGDVAAAVATAKAAQAKWGAQTVKTRVQALFKLSIK